nr:hypothetical protein BgiMline_007913 [Biomphalaria glabrata]
MWFLLGVSVDCKVSAAPTHYQVSLPAVSPYSKCHPLSVPQHGQVDLEVVTADFVVVVADSEVVTADFVVVVADSEVMIAGFE